ncbi:MAG: exonuclease subunit SbcD [Synechococcales cyanobacterium]
MNVLHFADLHLGSGLHHGRINPHTGLNTRLEDVVATLERIIDAALALPVDLVLFAGDAFPDATPPPLHQDLLAKQLCRLAAAGIPTVLLVGNHDQYGQGQEGSSLSLYRTLGVPGFVVGDQLATHRIMTPAGPVQVTTLPWINRSTLLARQDHLPAASELEHLLLQRLSLALEGEIRQLQPGIPSILLAHVMVDRARYGSERHLAVGKGFTVPLSLLTRPEYDYVALGHVHRHQVLSDHPPVIYPGSPERVDFGEEEEEKGYVLISLPRDPESGPSPNPSPNTELTYRFIPLPARPFRTVRLDLSTLPAGSPALNQTVTHALRVAQPEATILRLIYRLRPDQLESLDEHAIHTALQSTFSYSLHPEVISPQRLRLPHLDSRDPWQALADYLQTRPDLAPLHHDLLTVAATLIPSALRPEESPTPEDEDTPLQLDLL